MRTKQLAASLNGHRVSDIPKTVDNSCADSWLGWRAYRSSRRSCWSPLKLSVGDSLCRCNSQPTNRANLTLPHTKPAVAEFEETKPSTTDENCWTDSRNPKSRLATPRLLRWAFSLSIFAVKTKTAAASGIVLCARSCFFCSGFKTSWKSWRALPSGSSLLKLI